MEVPLEARVKLLMKDYAHFIDNPTLLTERLSLLVEMHGREVIRHWCAMAEKKEWYPLVGALLTQHYDPAYKRSSGVGLQQLNHAYVLKLTSLDSKSLSKAAEDLMNHER